MKQTAYSYHILKNEGETPHNPGNNITGDIHSKMSQASYREQMSMGTQTDEQTQKFAQTGRR
jgi:hypothetical protein